MFTEKIFGVISLGCDKNRVDTEKMLAKLEGKEEFLLIECFTITRELFDNYSIDYLFGDGQVKTFY